MRPKLPAELLERLSASGHPSPWRCKLQLRRGRTLFDVEINAAGEITKVGGRAIYSPSDLSFGVGIIEDATSTPS